MIGFFLALFSAISFSLNNIFAKKIIIKSSVWDSLLLTYIFVSVISFFFVLFFGNFNHEFNLKIFLFIFLGGFSGVVGIYALLKSFEKISVAETLAIANFFPFITLFLFYFFMKKPIETIDFILMILVFIGVIISLKKEKYSFNEFLLFPIITAICWGIYYYSLNILYAFNISSYNVTFYVETGIFIFILIYIIFIKKNNLDLKYSKDLILNGFFAGFFAMIGVLLFVMSVKYLNPSVSASIISSQIIFSSLFAYLFFKEKLDIRQIFGILIVVIGLVLFNIL